MSEAAATVLGAALSAFVALMIVIISKEQKVSEFRQAWIDALRADISDAISSASALSIIMQQVGREDRSLMLLEWSKATAALARVDLRLNLAEQLHRDLEKCVRFAEVLLRRLEADPADYDQRDWIDLQDKVISVTRPLLKAEWNRVRSGELIFRVTKWVLSACVVAAPTIYLGILICRSLPH